MMAWRMYRIEFEALSPLCIGERPIGFVRKCRHYIPGRSVWGALTAALTRQMYDEEELKGRGHNKKFEDTGKELLNKYFIPGYLYVLDGDLHCLPHYREGGLHYGPDEVHSIPVSVFERRYIGGYGQTAIDPDCRTATESSLHEMEYLVRVSPETLMSLKYAGYFFLRSDCPSCLNIEDSNSHMRKAMRDFSIGGARRVGFGRLRYFDHKPLADSGLPGWRVDFNGAKPLLKADKASPVLSNLQFSDGSDSEFEVTGKLELLSGLIHDEDKGNGQKFNKDCALTAAPGSVSTYRASVNAGYRIEVGDFGIWKLKKA